jgi:hypothetical protein
MTALRSEVFHRRKKNKTTNTKNKLPADSRREFFQFLFGGLVVSAMNIDDHVPGLTLIKTY